MIKKKLKITLLVLVLLFVIISIFYWNNPVCTEGDVKCFGFSVSLLSYLLWILILGVLISISLFLMSGLKKWWKILGIIVICFLYYYVSASRPNQVGYGLYMKLNGIEKAVVLNDTYDKPILNDNFIITGKDSNVDLFINKGIKSVHLLIDSAGISGSDPYEVDLDDVTVEVGNQKFRGDKFNFELAANNADEQSYRFQFSWHGGVFWEKPAFEEEVVLNVHWLDVIAFKKLFMEEKYQQFSTTPSTLIEIDGYGADSIDSLPVDMKIKNNSIFDVKDLSVNCSYWNWEKKNQTTFLIPEVIEKGSTGSFPYPSAIKEANFPGQFSVSCVVRKVMIINE